jgi:hypothetical protein
LTATRTQTFGAGGKRRNTSGPTISESVKAECERQPKSLSKIAANSCFIAEIAQASLTAPAAASTNAISQANAKPHPELNPLGFDQSVVEAQANQENQDDEGQQERNSAHQSRINGSRKRVVCGRPNGSRKRVVCGRPICCWNSLIRVQIRWCSLGADESRTPILRANCLDRTQRRKMGGGAIESVKDFTMTRERRHLLLETLHFEWSENLRKSKKTV